MAKIANLVQEVTTAVGTLNTIPLVAISGFARFADRFAVGDAVHYTIEDGANWEIGVGTVAANHTITRSTIHETYVGGVLTAETPSRINLSGGNALVRCVASEQYITSLANSFSNKLDKNANLSDLANATTARAHLGLSNVDNTSDADKPVSSATLLSLGEKASIAANLADLDDAEEARANIGLGPTDDVRFTRIGLGLSAAPSYILHLRGETGGAAGDPSWVLFGSNNRERLQIRGTQGSFVQVYRAENDAENPDAGDSVMSSSTLGGYQMGGWDGTQWIRAAELRGVAAEAWSGAVRGAYLSFLTTAVGQTSMTEKMRLHDDGELELISNALTRGGDPERLTYGSPVTRTNAFISLKQGTAASPNTAADYLRAPLYIERYMANPTGSLGAAGNSDWSSERMRPAILVETMLMPDEAGAPLGLATRTYTTTPQHGAYDVQRFVASQASLAQSNAGTWNVTSITRAGATATATTDQAHGWSTGANVVHSGAGQAEYNGEFTITVTGPTTYTFAVAGTPVTPATGTIVTKGVNRDVFTHNIVASFPTGYKPRNLVCIEADVIPGASATATLSRSGTDPDNFTAFWAQNGSPTYDAYAGFMATSMNDSVGWQYGVLVDCAVKANLAYFNTPVDSSGAKGVYIKVAYDNDAAGRVLECHAGANEQFHVNTDPNNPINIRVGGALKNVLAAGPNSFAPGYQALVVPN
jgi:hypothetical protein